MGIRGSFLLSRLVNYFPARFSRLAFVDVGYTAPGRGLTKECLGYIDTMVNKAVGYSVFGYFVFFDDDDAADLLNDNVSPQGNRFTILLTT